jgi:XTP/dITP diphosphohydrolase
VLVATRSAGKLRELAPLFAELGLRAVGLEEWGLPYEADEEAIERFETFEANAIAKARYFYEVSGGIATVADDSGLQVAALGDAPGVRSRRWAGDDRANNEKLVSSLSAADDRRATYVCAAAYVDLDREIVRRGEVEGTIVDAPRGANGFGYDPYFYSPELARTFGEATVEEKARVSHRARAFRALLANLHV